MSFTTKDRQVGRDRRHRRVRKKVVGTTARPRLARTLRAGVFLAPVAASVVSAWTVNHLLPPAAGRMEQLRKAEEARKQFETALQITDRALDHARQQLQRAGIPFGE